MTVRYDPIVRSFNAGELTEMLAERSDLEKYHSGCSILENFVVTPHGPAQKMPGTKYVAVAKDANARLLPFHYNTTDTMILEVGPGYVRFMKNGRPVYLDDMDSAIQTWSDWTRYRVGDIVYAASPNNAPYVCVRDHLSSDTFSDDEYDVTTETRNWYQQAFEIGILCDDTTEGTTEAGCTRITASVSDPNYWYAFFKVHIGDFVYCSLGTSPDGFYRVLGLDPQYRRWVDIDLAFTGGQTVSKCSPVIFQITMPYQHVARIHRDQKNDVLYFAHADYPTAKLMRYGRFKWKYEPVQFRDGPFSSERTMDRIDDAYVCPSGADTARLVKAGSFKSYAVGHIQEVDYSESLSGVLVSENKTLTAIDSAKSNYVEIAATGIQAAIGTAGSTRISAVEISDNGSGYVRLTKNGAWGAFTTGDTVQLTPKDTYEDIAAAVYTGNLYTGNDRVGICWTDSTWDGFVKGDWIRVNFPDFPNHSGIYKIAGVNAADRYMTLHFDWPSHNFGYAGPWKRGDAATYPVRVVLRYPYHTRTRGSVTVASTNYIDTDIQFRGPTTWAGGENAHVAEEIVASDYLSMLKYSAAATSNGATPTAKVRVTVTEITPEMVVGSYLYFDFAAAHADGWRKITAVDKSAKTIDLDLNYVSNETVHVYKSRITADLSCPTSLLPSAVSGPNIMLTASDDTFDPLDVGRLVSIDQYREAAGGKESVTVNAAATGNTKELLVSGSWEVTTNAQATSVWTATLERKKDAWSPWEAVRTWSRDSANVLDSGDDPDGTGYYRLVVSSVATATFKGTLSSRGNRIRGVCQITKYVSPVKVNAKVLRPLYAATATTEWHFGKYSKRTGYPSTLTFHEDRLCLAGVEKYSNEIDRSAVGDYENFKEGTNDDDAQIIELNTSTNNAIQWILGKGALFVGTAGGEHAIRGANGEPTTMANIRKDDLSNYGSRNLQPQLAGDAVLFTQRQGKKIREIVYSYEAETSFSSGYIANDLSILAPQVTESGIVDMAYMMTPFPILWCVCNDGTLAGMSYERAQRVAAWHRHTTEGNYKSVAVINGPDEDELWVIVERGSVTYIEQLWSFDIVTDIEDQRFVHCGVEMGLGDPVSASITVADHSVTIYPSSLPVSDDGIVMMKNQGCQIAIRGLPYYLTYLDYDKTGHYFLLGEADGYGYRLNVMSTNPAGVEYDPDGSLPPGTYSDGFTMTWVTGTCPNVAGLDHRTDLNDGKTVYETDCSAVNYFTLDRQSNKVVCGIPYTATLAPMPFNVDYAGGTTRNKQRRVVALAASLFRTGKCKVGYDLTKMEDIKIEGETIADDELVTGLARKNIGGAFTKDPVLYVVSEEPRQCIVRAIVPQFEIGED